jgi:hypothetical protein
MAYQDEGLYEQMKTDVRIKSMGVIQNFQACINKYYTKEAIDKLYEDGVFKSIKDINFEVFGSSIDSGASMLDGEDNGGMVNIIA